ncbi:MAG: TlpA family protein disulfide reductase [Chloroflexia bacterium]|nr:TlpA family protein disulfide reductase [Chloroflexia bacterium]
MILKPYVWVVDSIERKFPKSLWVKEVVGNIRYRIKMQDNEPTSGSSSDFELNDIGNKPIKLSAYHGSYVLLDFWASWCTPCINEMPHTIEIQNKYSEKGLKVITISIDKNKEVWLKAIEKHNMQNLINLHDEKGDAARAYNVSYVPLTV